MQYKYAKEQADYSDFASGRVFYSLPGHPAFPIRLASEIFQRCAAHRERLYKVTDPVTLYDPCCGAAYHLSVLACLQREHLREIIGSDIDEKAIAFAERNLGLLSADGLENRIREISKMFEQYGKAAHQDALRSAHVLKEKLSTFSEKPLLPARVFQASATDRQKISTQIKPRSVDLVFTDIPYGQHSLWQAADFKELSNPVEAMLAALLDILSPASIVAIASDKQQKAAHTGYQRIEHFKIGKRRVTILKPV